MRSWGISTLGEWLDLCRWMPRFMEAQRARDRRIEKAECHAGMFAALNLALWFYVSLFWLCAGLG